jgi:hypothetical protein
MTRLRAVSGSTRHANWNASDQFGGIIVDPEKLPEDVDEFARRLRNSLDSRGQVWTASARVNCDLGSTEYWWN